MTDTKEEKPTTLKMGGTLKLQLNKPMEPGKLRTPTVGGLKGKTVTVEVKKHRGGYQPRELSGTESTGETASVRPTAVKPVTRELNPADAQDKRSLSESERNQRLDAIRNASLKAAQEDARKLQERKELEYRTKEESSQKKKEEEEQRLEEKRIAELKKLKENKSRKKHKDEVDLTETFIASRANKKQELTAKIEPVEEFEEEEPSKDILAPVIEEEKPVIISRKSAFLDNSDEVEDYSEEVENEADDEQQILRKSRVSETAKISGVVRPVKGADKLIIASADREKLKKSQRSEAMTVSSHKPKLRLVEERKNSVRSVLSQYADAAEERAKSVASLRRRREKLKKTSGYMAREPEKIYREVVLPESISVQELANRMSERVSDVVKALMKMGIMVTTAQVIDADTAELITAEFGHKVKRVAASDVENILAQEEDTEVSLTNRPPVVTIMGHVDHGKTTLLDALRHTNVASGEAGGITQHIGAYQVQVPGHGKVTFIDTPGHAAFTAMRARGAKVTDIVVLVVAADDGIKEQTVEAINHAKAAGVPIVVAVNKIDKPGVDASRVKNELLANDLVAEEFGGDVMVVEVSAKARLNLDKLLEAILLQADILDLKANPDRRASGAVIEAKIDKGRGVVATVLVQKGTLKVGDIVVAGSSFGYVRMMLNDKGQTQQTAEPSAAVEVLGLDAVPSAGDDFAVVDSEKTARDISEYRRNLTRGKALTGVAKLGIEQFMKEGVGAGVKELNVIVKADVHGSAEAINSSLEKIQTEEARVRVLHSGVGAITESDIALAEASKAVIVGFNVRANVQAKDLAARMGVQIRYYSIIYEMVDEMKKALAGILSPKEVEKFIGYAAIRRVYEISKLGKISGCMVTQGVIKRGSKVRLLRDNVVIHEGWLKTLRRFKDDVREVKEGFECGMSFENYDDIREGDVIEASEIEKVAATVE